MEPPQNPADYFNAVAPQWDRMRAGYFGEEVRRAALNQARLKPHQTAADLGCGTGYLLEAIAPLVKEAYGVDASAGMLKEAEEKMRALGFKHVTLLEGRMEALPLEDASLDAAFSNMVLHHLPEPTALLAEARRALRPGGRYIVTDLDEHQFAWMKEEMQDLWLGFPRPRIVEWFKQTGFVNVGIDCVSGSCCASSVDNEPAQIGIFVAWGEKAK